MKLSLTIILLYFVLTFCLSAVAKPKNYMACLGKEEQMIHKKKIGGAFFKLNQDLIGALLQFPSFVKMTPKMFKKICHKESKFPSLQLLKYLILNNPNIFYIDTNKHEVSQIAMSKLAIKELRDKSLHIFINFLNTLQAEAPNPNCIIDSIEELKVIYLNLRYLEEELGTQKIIHGLSQKQKIFKKLENAPAIIESCKESIKRQKL